MTQASARAFLALWNGTSGPQIQPEYETWHSFEHVPERVGLPGFVEARRYRALGPGRPYFTCYWLHSREALASAAYREVVAHPTPWSARMRGELRDFLRLPCDLAGAHGVASAARLATLQLRCADTAALGACLDPLLRALVADAGLVCAHWGLAHPSDDFPLTNQTAAAPAAPHEAVLMLQHLDLDTLRASCAQLLRSLAPVATAAEPPACYELLGMVRQDALSAPLSARQPARPDLLQRFLQGDQT